ncbi:site-specific DNA-methyltransferase, partial [Patescibacteria group bacterium]|nr:site-specific DNA-methyltransferase [Patescibacteria group bacterium]
MDGKSLNPQEELLALLKSKLPEIFAEGKIDCQRLKQSLGEEVNLDNERYGMTWAGKSNCFRVIQESTTATLKPVRDESVDFDETENLFIEGNNLGVLKILQKSYYGKIKMIYIDPPYNTGNDFIYNDDFKQNKAEYEQEVGIKDDNGNLRVDGLHKNTKDRGHYHSDWMNMMYPRLFLARNLLSQDGVIFVSIDDNEIKNLRVILDEVFGEENFLAQITLLCNPKGRAQDKHFATNHEFVLVYSKQPLPKGAFTISKEKEQIESEYTEEDATGKYRALELRNTHREFGKHNRKNLYYPLFVDPQNGSVGLDETKNSIKVLPNWDDGFEGCWTWGKPKAEEDIDFLVGKTVNGDKKWKIFVKDYANGATKMLKT